MRPAIETDEHGRAAAFRDNTIGNRAVAQLVGFQSVLTPGANHAILAHQHVSRAAKCIANRTRDRQSLKQLATSLTVVTVAYDRRGRLANNHEFNFPAFAT
jgi:hypothetical protein